MTGVRISVRGWVLLTFVFSRFGSLTTAPPYTGTHQPIDLVISNNSSKFVFYSVATTKQIVSLHVENILRSGSCWSRQPSRNP